MRAGLLLSKVVHVHLTRRCNLECLHCYSASSPTQRDTLDINVLLRNLEFLRTEGYEVVSLSGGEPLLYKHLSELVTGAVALGYSVNIVTNGSLVTERRLAEVANKLNLVAVSIDGRPEFHNKLRGRADAFERAETGIKRLIRLEIPTAVIFCASRESLPDVPWAYDFASEIGAKALQIHPLVLTGRAKEMCRDYALNDDDKERLFVTVRLLSITPNSSRLRLHLDLVETQKLFETFEQFTLFNFKTIRSQPLARLVNPLIITETGSILPFAYGVHDSFELATVHSDLAQSIDRFRLREVSKLVRLLMLALESVRRSGQKYVEWYEEILAASFGIHEGSIYKV